MAGILENPPVLQQPFAYNGDKNTIPLDATGDQRASLQEGFPPITSVKITEGGIPPERKDFNGLGNLLSSLYFYLQNGGQFTFNQDVSDAIGGYPQGSVLSYTNTATSKSYKVISLINNNTFNFVVEPSYIDGVKWAKAYSDDLSPYQLKSNLSQAIDSSTEKYPSNKAVHDAVRKALPVGALIPVGGNTIPSGYLRCDGSAISRTLYPELFAAIGTTYGAGDGVNTFNIPNFVNRTFWGGATSGAYLAGTLPNITGTVGNLGRSRGAIFTGAFYDAGKSGDVDYSNVVGATAGFDASRVSNKYQNGALVRPESVQTMILIKY